VRPAFTPPKPKELRRSARAFRWAPVLTRVTARSRPESASAPIATLWPKTPEGTPNLVLVLRTSERPGGQVWVKARLPVLPNNTTGWLPRPALGGYTFVRTHLVIDVRRFRAWLLRDGRQIFEAEVGVGEPASPTPPGEFYVRNKLTRFRSSFYGPLAFGTSARSAVLTDWPAGGFVGIHGTSEPQLIPGAISHGCIRMRNEDILRLARLMPVGTPITIR
jgi:L,D-transpeptidase catalytic domain